MVEADAEGTGMRLSKESEEVIQALFSMDEEGESPAAAEKVLARARVPSGALRAAAESGHIVRESGEGEPGGGEPGEGEPGEGEPGPGEPHGEGGRYSLTDLGRKDAALLARRHRLAERLLYDVLHVADEATELAACEVEHFLEVEVTDSICTLLGHPRVCPHGKPIPPGACCEAGHRKIAPVVERLSGLSAGDVGTVAYVHTSNLGRLDRLASFGLVPGTPVTVHQTWPSVVVALGETELAFDLETSEDIYIRRSAEGREGSGRS